MTVMRYVTFHVFKCRKCAQPKSVKGRKKLKEGWMCAECAKGE